MRALILGCAAIGLAAALMAGGHQVIDHEQVIAVEPHYESLMIGRAVEIDTEDARAIFERRKKYPPRQVAETDDQPRDAWDRDHKAVV